MLKGRQETCASNSGRHTSITIRSGSYTCMHDALPPSLHCACTSIAAYLLTFALVLLFLHAYEIRVWAFPIVIILSLMGACLLFYKVEEPIRIATRKTKKPQQQKEGMSASSTASDGGIAFTATADAKAGVDDANRPRTPSSVGSVEEKDEDNQRDGHGSNVAVGMECIVIRDTPSPQCPYRLITTK